VRQVAAIFLLCLLTFAKAPSLLERFFEQESDCHVEDRHLCDSENHEEGNWSYTFNDNAHASKALVVQPPNQFIETESDLILGETSSIFFTNLKDRAPPLG
jgi:hypothetical protein